MRRLCRWHDPLFAHKTAIVAAPAFDLTPAAVEKRGDPAMTRTWKRAVEHGADALGEMLIDMAGGTANYTYEDLASVALTSGLQALTDDEPDLVRVDVVAAAIYAKLHDVGQAPWESLTSTERAFWLDLGRTAISASDSSLVAQTKF